MPHSDTPPPEFPTVPGIPPSDSVELLRAEMEARWAGGERAPAEAFVARLPNPDPEIVVDLVFCEFLVRERAGEVPTADEYAARFPAHAAVIRDQINLHRAVAGTLPGQPSATWTISSPRGHAPHAAAPEPLPRPFGRYVLLEVLGRGGMGVVYLAEDPELGRRVALKMLRDDLGSGKAARRFEAEARLSASLAHPHLCPVHDVGLVGEVRYLTMPHFPGGSLAERVKQNGPLPEADAVRIVRQVAGAVAAAHAAGVIHRDLKPHNVLFDARGEPVVTDFGLARRVAGGDARLTATGDMLGTPAYMPPEQAGGDSDAVGPGCDVYSLGVILYELLTGRVPFTGTTGEVLRQLLTTRPPPIRRSRPDIDPRVEAAYRRATAREPGDRFGTMAEFAAALPDPADLRPPGKWRKWWPWALAGFVAVGLAVAGWWLNRPETNTANTPTPPNTPTPDPAAKTGDDLVQPGTRWIGEFRWATDPTASPHPFELKIIARDGKQFRGEQTSNVSYRWAVDGTVSGGGIDWKLSKALTDEAAATGATGKAIVNGWCTGRKMRVTFHDSSDGSQTNEFELTLRE